MEPQWDGGTKVCSWGLGHMTKMAVTLIYDNDPSKIFLSITKGPMTLWLGTLQSLYYATPYNKVLFIAARSWLPNGHVPKVVL